MVAVERLGPHKLGRVRFDVATKPGSLQLVDFGVRTVAAGSTIRTDSARMFRRFADLGFVHKYSDGYNAPAEELPGVHLVASLLKRWVAGTLHHHVSLEHLPYYRDEYSFRFNRRASSIPGMLFYRLLQQAIGTDHTPSRT